jgi:putative transposase
MGRQNRRSRKQWAEIIESQSHSGLSAKKYCQQESIGLASFYQWRKRIDNEAPERSVDSEIRKGPFIDMGPLGTDSSDMTANEKGITITLDLGGGLKLTVRRS